MKFSNIKYFIAAGILAGAMCFPGVPQASAQNEYPPTNPGYYGQDNGSGPGGYDSDGQNAPGYNGQDYDPNYQAPGYPAPNAPPPNYAPNYNYAPPAAPGYDEAYGSYGPPPVCPYGYYSYYPYACAPYGYYAPEYFYNGFFVGAGPWFGWG